MFLPSEKLFSVRGEQDDDHQTWRQIDDMENTKDVVNAAAPRLKRCRVTNEVTKELLGMVNAKIKKCGHEDCKTRLRT